ncbi:50S ribosomal protein L13, partial [Candidatus Woesearchaeota archaeon]|nr:50S ribosomal protein L13 [Candidatus Woesearchaeota archaeon]
MIIDATDTVLGRLASYVAKKALLGETIEVVNSEKAIVTGKKNDVLAKYLHRLQRGSPRWGPFVYRQEPMFVKRTIRGMLPHKQYKGIIALKRIKCYLGLPDKFKNQKLERLEQANISKLR